MARRINHEPVSYITGYQRDMHGKKFDLRYLGWAVIEGCKKHLRRYKSKKAKNKTLHSHRFGKWG